MISARPTLLTLAWASGRVLMSHPDNSSSIFHYTVNVIGHGQSRKLRDGNLILTALAIGRVLLINATKSLGFVLAQVVLSLTWASGRVLISNPGNLKLDFMAKSIGIHFCEFENIFRCYRDTKT